jgi:hypothetical protein
LIVVLAVILVFLVISVVRRHRHRSTRLHMPEIEVAIGWTIRTISNLVLVLAQRVK